jgi:Lon protease-like protein
VTCLDSSIIEVPIFPLGSVLFPAGRMSLRIFEPRYVEMTRTCLREGSGFGVVLIRAGFEAGRPAIPHDVGCLARIIECQETAPDRYSMTIQGETIFRILERRVNPAGLIIGRLRVDEPPDPTPPAERHEHLIRLLSQTIRQIGAAHFPQPMRLEDAAWVGNRLAELLPITPERKQRLLEVGDPLALLDAIQLAMASGDGGIKDGGSR